MLPLVQFPFNEQGEMLEWCKRKGMEMQRELTSDKILVKFTRDKNTYDFIKEFLEWKVRRALPFESLMKIDGVEIVNF